MACSSFGQIGALNAESFCERVLRGAGHVLTEGNTLLADDELEKLVILRINRDLCSSCASTMGTSSVLSTLGARWWTMTLPSLRESYTLGSRSRL